MPLVYLVIRTLGAGSEAWELLFRERTLHILVRSLLLVVSVTGASIAIAVPLAWLTVRTDLPWRRVWSVAIALPHVEPRAPRHVAYIGTKRCISPYRSTPSSTSRRYAFSEQP